MTCDMDEIYMQTLMELAKILQKKYNCMSEIFRLTEEAAQALGRDDKVSVQMILGMRGEEMDRIRECDKNVGLFRDGMPPELADWLSEALEGKLPVTEDPYGKEGAVILRIAANTRSVWERTMVVDRRMNMRLSGKDSFYTDK